MSNNVRSALKQLVTDIEAMYRGTENVPETGDQEEFFGPFSIARSDRVYMSEMEISWPNLAISLREAKAALQAEH